MMRERLGIHHRPRLIRVRERSRRLAAESRNPCRARGSARPPAVGESSQAAGLGIRVTDWQHVIRVELFGDLSSATVSRLSSCLERALETRARRIILDLRGLERLAPEAVNAILIAQLVAASEHRQLLLIPGSASVQPVLDRVQGPFAYLAPDDDFAVHYDVGTVGVPGPVGLPPGRRRIVDLLIGPTDRLIVATEHASEPISRLEYVGASALLGALELWLSIADRVARSRG